MIEIKGATIGFLYGLISVLFATDILGMGFYSGKLYQYEVAKWTIGLPLFIGMRYFTFLHNIALTPFLGRGFVAIAVLVSGLSN